MNKIRSFLKSFQSEEGPVKVNIENKNDSKGNINLMVNVNVNGNNNVVECSYHPAIEQYVSEPDKAEKHFNKFGAGIAKSQRILTVKDDNQEEVLIKIDEETANELAKPWIPENLELTGTNVSYDTIKMSALVVKPDLQGDSKWVFQDESGRFEAKIEDDLFKKKIKDGLSVSSKMTLTMDVEIMTIKHENKRPSMKHVVKKVKNIIEPDIQDEIR